MTKNKVKSVVITITPEKNRLLSQQQSKKFKRRLCLEESQQVAVTAALKSLLILIHRMFLILVIRIQLLVEVLDDAPAAQENKMGDYVLVEVFSETNSFRHFISCIIDEQDEDGDYEVKFRKALSNIKNAFFIPKRMT